MDSALANFSWHGFVPVKVSKGFKKFSSTPTLMFPLRLLDTDCFNSFMRGLPVVWGPVRWFLGRVGGLILGWCWLVIAVGILVGQSHFGWPKLNLGWSINPFSPLALSRLSPPKVYPAGKLQCHSTCGFDFRYSLWLPFVTAFAVLKGLNASVALI